MPIFGGSLGRVIPESDSLHQWSAAVDDTGDVTNDTFGSADLLALLQIVHKFAPGAEIVIAGSLIRSTNSDGTPAGISSTSGPAS